MVDFYGSSFPLKNNRLYCFYPRGLFWCFESLIWGESRPLGSHGGGLIPGLLTLGVGAQGTQPRL